MAGCNCLRAVGPLNPGAFKPFRKSNLNCDAGERI